MTQFVARAARLADVVPAARSRKAFLEALSDFERMLTVTLDYPRGCFAPADLEALRALADRVIDHIEARVEAHAYRACVELRLVTTVYRMRGEVEAMYAIVDARSAGNPARNAERSAAVSPSR